MTAWTAVLPVKQWAHGKSRLAIEAADRAALARAFSLDVLDVAVTSSLVSRVVVVTSESELASIARDRGAHVLEDGAAGDSDRLNRAIGSARQWALEAARADPIVVIPGDLPALNREVLEATLELLAGAERAFVPDHSGEGTTLVATAHPDLMVTSYGPLSASRHSTDGFQAIADADARARLDVDTAEDLVEAQRFGVGHHTSSVLAEVTRTPMLRP